MVEKLDPRETISILKLTVSSIAAFVGVFERKGLLSKQEVWDVITELRRQTRRANSRFPFGSHPSRKIESFREFSISSM